MSAEADVTRRMLNAAFALNTLSIWEPDATHTLRQAAYSIATDPDVEPCDHETMAGALVAWGDCIRDIALQFYDAADACNAIATEDA